MARASEEKALAPWRASLHTVIFESETPGGRLFDLGLLAAIVASIVVVLLESVPAIRARHGGALRAAEWGFTALFTVEYVLRLLSVRRPGRYARSFFGVIDLLAVLPTYLSVLVPGSQRLIVVRVFRLLRAFRVLKLVRFLGEADVLARALRASLPKVTVFVGTVLAVVLVAATLMYILEGDASGFTSIPTAMYWAIVTVTTVGYGDITPATVPGQLVAALLMLLGYGIIAVPTGIVTMELVEAARHPMNTNTACPSCLLEGHERDALFCRRCSARL